MNPTKRGKHVECFSVPSSTTGIISFIVSMNAFISSLQFDLCYLLSMQFAIYNHMYADYLANSPFADS